ncbi:hypothetical protein OSTOST_04673 [Ostertagia ostertagi]
MDCNFIGMRPYVPSASREAAKLYCSLLKASKQGDRIVKPPERYSSMDWSTKQRARDTSRSHDRYLYGDAAVGMISKSQAKRAYKEAAKVQRENAEFRGSEGEPNADEEEEAVTEESNPNEMNFSKRSTNDHSLDLSGRNGYQIVDENANNQSFMPFHRQGARTQQSSDFTQLPHDAANQVWRRIGDFDNGAEPLHAVTSVCNPFSQQTNPYMAMMAAPYRFQSTVPYYTPMTSYMNTPFYNPTYPQQNFSTPCQRYRERFITDVATTMLTTLLDKAATFDCCHEHCPDMSSGASRSGSAATIPALQSSSFDRMATSANATGFARPEALYENCEPA